MICFYNYDMWNPDQNNLIYIKRIIILNQKECFFQRFCLNLEFNTQPGCVLNSFFC